MESSLDPAEELLAADRAAAAPYIDYPPTPWWFALAAGLWATALVAAFVIPSPGVWMVVVVLLLVTVEGAFLGWYRRKRGTSPSIRNVPGEFRRAYIGYTVGAVAVVVLVAACIAWLPVPVTLGVTFVLVTAGLAGYEKVYERAAARTRGRLSS